jgi:hypothetical protein
MEQSSFQKAKISSASQEISPTLWNLTVHYHVDHSPPTVPFCSQMNLVHAIPAYFFTVNFLYYPGINA